MPRAPSERRRHQAPQEKKMSIFFLVTEMSRFRRNDLMSAPGAWVRLFAGYPMLLCHHFNLKLTFSYVQVFQLGKYKRRFPECFKRQSNDAYLTAAIPPFPNFVFSLMWKYSTLWKIIIKLLKLLISSHTNIRFRLNWDNNYTVGLCVQDNFLTSELSTSGNFYRQYTVSTVADRWMDGRTVEFSQFITLL